MPFAKLLWRLGEIRNRQDRTGIYPVENAELRKKFFIGSSIKYQTDSGIARFSTPSTLHPLLQETNRHDSKRIPLATELKQSAKCLKAIMPIASTKHFKVVS